jgi:transaldolase
MHFTNMNYLSSKEDNAMSTGYFHRVAKETPTKVWVNNPSALEVQEAIEAGAVCCTTNPSYISKVITQEVDYLNGVIDKIIDDVEDNNIAAERVYHVTAHRIIKAFLPIYEESEGKYGYVTIQGDPRLDKDPDLIVEEALRGRKLGPNFMAKIPVTKAGIEALERLVEKDVPLCATEIFSMSQAVHMCEVYQDAADRCGKHPPFFVTHITGIFDQLFQETVKKEHIVISPNFLEQSGCILARKEFRILKQRKYPGTMLGGGARNLSHFTEMVGGDLAVTLNWSTMEELIRVDGPVVSRIDVDVPQTMIDELCEKLPNFHRAYEEGALSVEEYEDFGPVVFFRTNFLNGYTRLLDAIADRRLLKKGRGSHRILLVNA